MVASEWLGRPIGFEAEGGGFYDWPAATLGNMRKDWAGGGVLIDFGSHLLDLLHFLFDGPGEVLDYRDNAWGGIEADCLLALRFSTRHKKLTAWWSWRGPATWATSSVFAASAARWNIISTSAIASGSGQRTVSYSIPRAVNPRLLLARELGEGA